MSDLISIAEAIRALDKFTLECSEGWCLQDLIHVLEELPSEEPEIIYCKDCRKHNQGINEAPYLADRCPLILHRGYAKGHEFDYQFCVYGERKENG